MSQRRTYVCLGYIIPKGWRVMIWLRQLHNDPTNFEDPMCFNPDRWEVSFSADYSKLKKLKNFI